MRDAQAIRFWTAFVALAALNIAGWTWVQTSVAREQSQPLVRLVHTGGSQEFGGRGRLPLQFDRDLFEQSAVGTTLVHSPFTIDPPTAGRWQVRARNELAFEPQEPPQPGRIYRVRREERHPIFSRFTVGGIDLPEIRYQPLTLLIANVKTIEPGPDSDPAAATHTVTLELLFNQKVAPSDLEDAVAIKVNSLATEVEFTTKEITDRPELTVQAPTGSSIELTLASELTGVGATLGLGSVVHRRFEVLRALRPTHTYANVRSFNDSDVSLYFNHRLQRDQATPPISIDPPVEGVSVSIRWNSIRLRGNFQPGTRYTFGVRPPLMGANKTTLTTPFERQLTIPARPAEMKFEHAVGRLSPGGSLGLDLKHVGVRSAQIDVYRLPERNIPVYLAGLRSSWEVQRLGEHVATRTVVLDEGNSANSMRSVLQLEEFIERKPGIYLVSIEDTEVRWRYDDALVLVGDLALHLQRDTEGLLAWTTSVMSGEPVAGARVVVWSTNRRELIETTTDENGLAHLDIPVDVDTDLVTAAWDRDLAFVDPREARTLDDRTLAGSAWPQGLDVALYPDRGVHRPGELLRLSGLLRARDGRTLDALPLEVRLTRPDGRTVSTQTVMPSLEQGLFHVEIPTRSDAPTGEWVASCHLPGDEDPLTSLTCRVMPFVPVRIEVETSLEEAPSEDPQALAIRVGARYLHGAPAAALQARSKATFTPTRYSDKRFPKYLFEDPSDEDPVRALKTTLLDEAGRASVRFDPPVHEGTWHTLVETSVMETGGRATTRRLWTQTDTATRHLGARLKGGALHRPRTSIEVDAVLLDASGALDQTTPVTARIVTVAHEWSLHEDSQSNYIWRSVEVTRPLLGHHPQLTIKPDGSRHMQIEGLARGAYRVELAAEVTTSIDFHVSDGSARGRLAAARPDRLELIGEDGAQSPGSTTSVLIRSPFPGLALVTVETDRILSTQLARITEDGVRVPIEIPESVRDTCFVGATVLRPVDPTRTEWLPVRAHGAVRLKIDDTGHRLEPTITASDGARPGEQVHLSLALDDAGEFDPERTPAVAHVWAVDEGALLTTDFHAPNPLDWFFKKRRRVVRSIDTNAELLPDYARPATMAMIGGDLSSGYRAPVPVRVEETAVLWREHVPLDADGVLELDFTMPQIDGAMRVMAVVVDGDRYGSTEHSIGVVAPIEITATLPRAAAPGDRMHIPVRVQNRTHTEVEAAIRLQLGAGLEGGLDRDRVLLPAYGEQVLELELAAGEPGSAEVRLDLLPLVRDPKVPPRTFERAIAIRPPHGRRREVLRMRIPGESEHSIERDHALEAFAGRVEVFISDDPIVDINPVIEGLIDYPYGCGEQTGSRTRGLLAAASLPDEVLVVSKPEIAAMIQVGIDRLYSMQQTDGGISYWPRGYSTTWVTLQTGLIAIEARELEYELPSGFFEGIARYARRVARPDSTAPDSFFASMACRLLSHTDEPDEPLMRTLASMKSELDLGSKAHLAEAFFLLGLDPEADRLLEGVALPGALAPTDNGRFNSDLSQAALALDVLLRNRPQHPLVPQLVTVLVEGRKSTGWRTTYESAAAISALVRWFQIQPAEEPIAGTISIAGRSLQFDSEGSGRFAFDTDPSDGLSESIRTSGPGTAHLVVVTSGIPIEDQLEAPLARGLSIKRAWFDSTGARIKSGTPLTSGDLVIVELTVRALGRREIPNVAIVEVLPGGMEFELPALTTSASREEVNLAEVDHAEFHDDRLIAFTTVGKKPTTVRYVLRAIVPGQWQVPRADALAMYDAAVHAHGQASRVEILRP